MPANKILLNC